MRILVMAGNYAPEKTASAPLTSDFCCYLTAAGHSVSVVTTFPHYPQWKVWLEYRGHFYTKEMIDGVSVYRIWNYIPKRPTPLKRVLYYGSFGIQALLPALASGRPDVIVCVTPPLELSISASFLKLLWRVPVVLWIKDLVPDIAIQLGMLKNPLLISLARRLENFAYAHATKLFVLGHSFAENICGKGVRAEKLAVVSDWVNTDVIRPDIPGAEFREKYEVDAAAFVVLHAGNIGDKQRLELLVRCAKLLHERKDIQFLIVGDGARKAAVVAEATSRGVSNVKFLPLQPQEQLAEMLAAADVLILHQHADVTDSVIPSKLLTYMAAGRPIIVTAAPESAAGIAVSRSGCGIAVEPENPTALAQAILRLLTDQEFRAHCGASGRAFVSANFSRSTVLSQLESLLHESAGIIRSDPQESSSLRRMHERALTFGDARNGSHDAGTSSRDSNFSMKLKIQMAIKRLSDVLIATAGLVLAAPLFLLIAILVRLESPGAVIFRQLRSGRNRRPFRMYKFRTMYEGVAHLRNPDGSAYVGRNDPRVTRAGRWLREFSLDEIPQLLNVLRGDMSIIGPRPETPEYTDELPAWALEKLRLRPGCLSMSLIHGRNELPWRVRNELDIDYIRNYSLLLDLTIFFRGVWAMLVTRRGVYSPGNLGANVSKAREEDAVDVTSYQTFNKE
jgi:colanic acid biosynthesis glycosyl transferase WcaI